MHITPTTYTVVDYCEAMLRKEVIVNREYQRSQSVWPAAARSFLVETILLGYPIPKLYLYQVTDLKSRKTLKHIVDGQQRSYTVLDFYQNKFELSRTSELNALQGRKFDQLPDEYQQKFVDYALSVDLLVSATEDEIREVFRRINSYTVPLNAEEKRHSKWQGEFKWFIYGLSKKYDQILANMGVFSDRQLVRMADAKLFSEIAYSLLFGIKTTTASNLEKLYKDKDDAFPEEEGIRKRIEDALASILDWQEIHRSALMRPYIFFALLLAVTHIAKPVDKFREKYAPRNAKNERQTTIHNLAVLADALEEPSSAPEALHDFISACAKTTNDEKRRTTIFQWLCTAIDRERL